MNLICINLSGSITEVIDDRGKIVPEINKENSDEIKFYCAKNDVTRCVKRKVFKLMKFAAENNISSQIVNLNEWNNNKLAEKLWKTLRT